MSQQGTIKRYSLIIEKLQRRQYPSFEDLKSSLHDEGFEISPRTLQRDIEQIRTEFGVVIIYDRSRKGYFIDFDQTVNFESFLRFLEIVSTADLLINTLNESKEALRYISFESEGSLTGLEHLRLLLQALREKRLIEFSYYNWHEHKTKTHVIEPYLLKQYQNRWYVHGKVHRKNSFLTFGIDRMGNLRLTDEKFIPDSSIDVQAKFRSVVGITVMEKKREIVKLSVLYPQANYFKTLPLHETQEIEKDDGKEMIFSIYVIPNFELIQKILMQAEFIKVLEPGWLAKDVVKRLSRITLQYRKKKQLKPEVAGVSH